MSDMLKSKVRLTEFGNSITLPILLTHNNAYLITFVLAIKKNIDEKKDTTCQELYDKYMYDNNGNLNYFEYIINLGCSNDLLCLDLKTAGEN